MKTIKYTIEPKFKLGTKVYSVNRYQDGRYHIDTGEVVGYAYYGDYVSMDYIVTGSIATFGESELYASYSLAKRVCDVYNNEQ